MKKSNFIVLRLFMQGRTRNQKLSYNHANFKHHFCCYQDLYANIIVFNDSIIQLYCCNGLLNFKYKKVQ